jgi:broad specificity phosphatase PhoE
MAADKRGGDAVSDGQELWLLRHGETEWSRSGQHTSRTDLDLTPIGVEQAQAAGAALDGVYFDLVLTSPMVRARRTAELARLGEFEIDADLCEWDYGELEGLTTDQIRARYPGWTIWSGPWPGGETATQVAARADRLVARIRSLPSASKVVVVAHGHILRALTARWLGDPVEEGAHFGIDTATLGRLGWEHGIPAIKFWNLPAGHDGLGPLR